MREQEDNAVKMVRWAMVGTGFIANRFAKGMAVVKDAELAAVVSRGEETGRLFGERYGAGAVYTDYDRMLRETAPDIVYLAIPNDCHYEYIKKALMAGVNVLSEKPIVDTVKQLEELYALAREKGLLLIEGMWTRCFPAVKKVREWIAEGMIGEPLSVHVSFGFKADMDSWEVWKAGIEHCGGALRDVGIYSLAAANMAFPGKPEKISSAMHSNGEVDDDCSLLLDYGQGKAALLTGSFIQNQDTVAKIQGSEGEITFGPSFWQPDTAVLKTSDGSVITFEKPYEATGFQYEIMAAQKALEAGEIQMEEFTHEESLLIAGIIEEVRKSWGIYYPADK